ncbi:MAG TPA: IS110 family transposase [Candidatus Tectomicrobia bacterium]|jgi:transposase|nr:IS110 family transposase [Candidatus Tectomicrobia bacterium]
MPLYGGIDLHANNSVVVLLNEQDQVIYQRRLANYLPTILEQLAPYHSDIRGVVVESTYNWYWLVDGLMEADYRVHLANPGAMQQYSGLKYTDDHSDARWLAHLLRLGVLPEGYIYPKAARAVRDVLRKRAHLVRQQTATVLSLQNIIVRNTGVRLSAKRIHALTLEEIECLLPEPEHSLAVTSSLAVLHCLEQQIKTVEKLVHTRLKHSPAYEQLQTVEGIGTILAQTIVLETGDIRRFSTVGQYASYCRCVQSTKISNGKRKGQGNVKNGNPYLAWAYMEAAQFAIRFSPTVQRFYQRKQAKSHLMVARKAVAHKLARACYYIMRDLMPFDVHKAFG